MMELAALTPHKRNWTSAARRRRAEAAEGGGRWKSATRRSPVDPAEAMETVKAIRGVLARAGRSKAQLEQANATLADVREKAKSGREAEELARQQKNAMEESKRLTAKEREALAEISRYADMFKGAGDVDGGEEGGRRNSRTPKNWPGAQADGGQLDHSQEADECGETWRWRTRRSRRRCRVERRRQAEKELLQMRERLGRPNRRGRRRSVSRRNWGQCATRRTAQNGRGRWRRWRCWSAAEGHSAKVRAREDENCDAMRAPNLCPREQTTLGLFWRRRRRASEQGKRKHGNCSSFRQSRRTILSLHGCSTRGSAA